MNNGCPKCGQPMWVDANTRTPEPYCPHCEVTDTANKPADTTQVGGSHYKDMAVQPWHVMESVLTNAEFRGFLCGNVIKYAMRAGHKKDSDDAGKAQHYMLKLKEFDEKMQQMRNHQARE